MPRRYFHRKDENEVDIVKTLRQLGLRVHCWGAEADLIVQHGGMTMLCEVRPEGKPKEAREGRQERFQHDFMVYWLQNTEDCLQLAKTLKSWRAVLGDA